MRSTSLMDKLQGGILLLIFNTTTMEILGKVLLIVFIVVLIFIVIYRQRFKAFRVLKKSGYIKNGDYYYHTFHKNHRVSWNNDYKVFRLQKAHPKGFNDGYEHVGSFDIGEIMKIKEVINESNKENDDNHNI